MEEQSFGEHLKKMLPVYGLEKTYTQERVEHLCRVAMRYGHIIESEGFLRLEDEWINKNVN